MGEKRKRKPGRPIKAISLRLMQQGPGGGGVNNTHRRSGHCLHTQPEVEEREWKCDRIRQEKGKKVRIERFKIVATAKVKQDNGK